LEYKNIVLFNVTIGSFMAVFDSNVVVISLPTIVNDLKTSTFDALWVLMGYILVLAVLLLAIGRLGDVYGRVRLYNLGFAVFTVGSLLCAVSLNGLMLVIFRLVQGAGAALLFANSAAILTDAFPPNERGKAIGTNQVAGTAGSVLGLIAGGILTATPVIGWRAIFLVNVPIGVFATVWAYGELHELSTPLRGEKLDPLGNLTFAGGLTLFLLGLTLGALAGFDIGDYGLMLVGLLLLVAFVLVERRITNPMMDISLFKNRMFAGGILSNFLAALARGAVSLVLVFYFQGPLHLDALTAGVLLIPFSVAFVALGPVSGYLSDRYGARGLATVGLVISGIAFLWFATITVTTPYSQLLIPMVLAGIGSGMFVAPNIASIMNSVPPTRRGIASGMSSTLVSAGVLLSLGVSFAIMATSVPLPVLQSIFAGLPGGQAVDVGPFMNAIHEIFIIMGIASFAAVLPSSLRGGRFVEARVQAQDKLITSGRDAPVISGGE